MIRVWKCSTGGRIAAAVLLAVVVAPLVAGGRPAAAAVLLAVGGALWWLGLGRPRVTLSPSEVVVVNPWGTQRIPLSDVQGTGGAYAGLSIQRRSGGTVAAWAVQKSNVAKWSGKTTRADEVAAAVMTAARQARTAKGDAATAGGR